MFITELYVYMVQVIPQAVCSRYGLSFGAKFVSFVQFLLFIFFPVAYPISKVMAKINCEGQVIFSSSLG